MLDYLCANKPDLILLDYNMPGMSGARTMEVIRSDFSAYHIPIIFLTGRDDRESVMEVISKKPEGYILKSMKRDDILNMINNFFADRFLRK